MLLLYSLFFLRTPLTLIKSALADPVVVRKLVSSIHGYFHANELDAVTDESSVKYRSSPLSIARSLQLYLLPTKLKRGYDRLYSIDIPSKSFENYLALRIESLLSII